MTNTNQAQATDKDKDKVVKKENSLTVKISVRKVMRQQEVAGVNQMVTVAEISMVNPFSPAKDIIPLRVKEYKSGRKTNRKRRGEFIGESLDKFETDNIDVFETEAVIRRVGYYSKIRAEHDVSLDISAKPWFDTKNSYYLEPSDFDEVWVNRLLSQSDKYLNTIQDDSK
ncbi:MAG: hypothetical protein FWC80_00895 [Firmicutes bacterium]|nr:hypothetical protein [Bacillota bacterium]